jgi:hypothetical protein
LRVIFATFGTISGPQNSRLSTCFGTTSNGSSAETPEVVFAKWRWTAIDVTLGLIFVASLRQE